MRVYDHVTSTYVRDESLSVTEFAGRRWRARLAQQEREKRSRFIREGALRGLKAKPEHLRARDEALKVEVFGAYGGRCHCCDEGELAFLTLDDAHGLRQIIDGPALWGTLKRQNFPAKTEFVVVCFNCQMASMTLDGCPHRPGGVEARI